MGDDIAGLRARHPGIDPTKPLDTGTSGTIVGGAIGTALGAITTADMRIAGARWKAAAPVGIGLAVLGAGLGRLIDFEGKPHEARKVTAYERNPYGNPMPDRPFTRTIPSTFPDDVEKRERREKRIYGDQGHPYMPIAIAAGAGVVVGGIVGAMTGKTLAKSFVNAQLGAAAGAVLLPAITAKMIDTQERQAMREENGAALLDGRDPEGVGGKDGDGKRWHIEKRGSRYQVHKEMGGVGKALPGNDSRFKKSFESPEAAAGYMEEQGVKVR